MKGLPKDFYAASGQLNGNSGGVRGRAAKYLASRDKRSGAPGAPPPPPPLPGGVRGRAAKYLASRSKRKLPRTFEEEVRERSRYLKYTEFKERQKKAGY